MTDVSGTGGSEYRLDANPDNPQGDVNPADAQSFEAALQLDLTADGSEGPPRIDIDWKAEAMNQALAESGVYSEGVLVKGEPNIGEFVQNLKNVLAVNEWDGTGSHSEQFVDDGYVGPAELAASPNIDPEQARALVDTYGESVELNGKEHTLIPNEVVLDLINEGILGVDENRQAFVTEVGGLTLEASNTDDPAVLNEIIKNPNADAGVWLAAAQNPAADEVVLNNVMILGLGGEEFGPDQAAITEAVIQHPNTSSDTLAGMAEFFFSDVGGPPLLGNGAEMSPEQFEQTSTLVGLLGSELGQRLMNDPTDAAAQQGLTTLIDSEFVQSLGQAEAPVYTAPNGEPFPSHWGEPPEIQTMDLVDLPGGYGQGSSSLANWISQNIRMDLGAMLGASREQGPSMEWQPSGSGGGDSYGNTVNLNDSPDQRPS